MAIDKLILRSVFTLADSVTLLHLSFQTVRQGWTKLTHRAARGWPLASAF